MKGPRTVLLVEDDPGILHFLSRGLASALEGFEIVTASNGQEAVEELERRHVDVLVTDLGMPIMDGFSLLGYVTNRRSALSVVVLSGMAPHTVDARLEGYGGLRVLRKPTTYRVLADVVNEEIARVDRGHVEGISLAAVLQLLEAERRTCIVVVRSGRRRGRLYFESGRLINAFSDDFGGEGDAAAFDILGWVDTAIEFEPLPHDVRRLVTTSLQGMLIGLAANQDERAVVPQGVVAEQADPTTSQGDRAAGDGEPASASSEPEQVEPTLSSLAADHGSAGVAAELTVATEGEIQSARDEEAHRGFEAAVGPGLALASAPVAADASISEPAPRWDAESPAEARIASDGGHGDAPVAEAAVSDPDGDHVQGMIEAIERLARRAREADAALAAVALDVEAFLEARRRFDAVQERQQRRRRELEAFREDVGRLAREILGRLDGLFDGLSVDAVEEPAGAAGRST